MEQEHYYAIETKDNELKHYGVKGMHWGIRRYQPYTSNPRKGGKTGKFIGNKSKATKDDKGSMVGLGVGLAAAAIVGAKAAKAAAHRAQSKKVAKAGAKAAIKEAEAEKRKAEFEEYKKSVKNRKWTDHTDEEKKYAYTDAEKKSEMKLAKEKDQYNIDFLETIQNDYFLSDDHPDNKKIRQQEYKKYLDNPYRYMSTHDAVEDRPKSSDSKSGVVKDSKKGLWDQALKAVLSEDDANNAIDSINKAKSAVADSFKKQHEANKKTYADTFNFVKKSMGIKKEEEPEKKDLSPSKWKNTSDLEDDYRWKQTVHDENVWRSTERKSLYKDRALELRAEGPGARGRLGTAEDYDKKYREVKKERDAIDAASRKQASDAYYKWQDEEKSNEDLWKKYRLRRK